MKNVNNSLKKQGIADSFFWFTAKNCLDEIKKTEILVDKIINKYDNMMKDTMKELEKMKDKLEGIYIEKRDGKITKVIINGKEYVKKEK